MVKSGLAHSVRKFLRREKSRLRREIFDPQEAEKKVKELVVKTRERYNKKNLELRT